MKHKCVGFCCLAVFAAATLAQDKPRLENTPKFAVGDRWVYKETDVANNKEPFTYSNEVKEVNDDVAWLYAKNNRAEFWWKYDVKRAVFIERSQFSAEAADKRGKVTFTRDEKDDVRDQFPLEVGKTYPVTDSWTNAKRQRGDRQLKVTVESYEKVKTPAGEFDAYRISAKGWWNKRFDPDYPNNPQAVASGIYEGTDWYAPAAKRIVKYEVKTYWQGQIQDNVAGELVEFAVSP